MTAEQHKAYTEACNAFGEALEKIFKTEVPMIRGQDVYVVNRSLRIEDAVRDWEILEFKQKINTEFDLLLFEPGNYMTRDKQLTYRLDHALDFVKDGLYSIHSVRRLSDNTVWTVGQNTLNGPVQKFEILGASIRARVDMGFMGLPALRQPKKAAIFTTADGVEVYEKGTPIYKTSAMGWIEIFNGIPDEGEQWYSTREAAEKAYDEWLYTRPILSIWDLDGCSETGDALTARLKQLVKDKILKR